MKFGFKNEDLKKMHTIFEQFPDIHSVIIFGSRAMGNYKKGSDIDLVLLGNIEPSILNKVKFLLNEETPLPYFFDIVLYNEIENQDLKHHIDHNGKVIYEKKD